MQCCCIRWTEATPWCKSYDYVQACAIFLLYVQVVCALIGSLGALYNGVVLMNLALALFALVAIESGSQTLGRAYAGLLACALILDIIWFILFTSEIRHISKDSQLGNFGTFSVKLMFWMQVAGCALRFMSSVLWIQMYRLGAAADTASLYHPVDFEGRIGNLGIFTPDCPTPASVRQSSNSDEVLGGSIYDPAAYSSLFQYTHEPYFSIETPPKEAGASDGLNMQHLYLPPKVHSLSFNDEEAPGPQPAPEPPPDCKPP